MKLLLCKNVSPLGIVGDVVDVSSGYARNFLLPQRLATEPTPANMQKLKAARRVAEQERAQQRLVLEGLIDKLNGVEVTIRARANESGALYGSVGRKEIASALAEEGYFLTPEQVNLSHPIRQLDSTAVELRLAEDLRTSIKVWVVREKTGYDDGEEGEERPSDEPQARTEAGSDDNGADE